MRREQIEPRKVHGKSTPADLPTKHLPSRDQLGQLAALFGCAFKGGGAIPAPIPRKRAGDPEDEPHEDDCEIDVIDDSEVDIVIIVRASVVHDIRVWLKMHSSEAVDRLFPLVVAAEAIERTSKDTLGWHAALHNGWATIRSV